MTPPSIPEAKVAALTLGIAVAAPFGAKARAQAAKPINKSRFIVLNLQHACSRAGTKCRWSQWFQNEAATQR
jgi:hypothetical protein